MVASFEDFLQIGDTGSLVFDPYQKELRRARPFNGKFDFAAACVAEGVARQLGYRGSEARLILSIEV